MTCTKCKRTIADNERYHRTKKGCHHRACPLPALNAPAGQIKVTWIDATVQLPDSDTTVMIHCPTLDDPVWLGYHDGETWRVVDGEAMDKSLVDHWADLPEAPPQPWHGKVGQWEQRVSPNAELSGGGPLPTDNPADTRRPLK